MFFECHFRLLYLSTESDLLSILLHFEPINTAAAGQKLIVEKKSFFFRFSVCYLFFLGFLFIFFFLGFSVPCLLYEWPPPGDRCLRRLFCQFFFFSTHFSPPMSRQPPQAFTLAGCFATHPAGIAWKHCDERPCNF